MARRIRDHDWAANPLGLPADWSPPLKAMVRMALTTRHPIFIWWGPELTCLYNDAYRELLGAEKHPSILGAPGREAWGEIWHIIGPQIELVLRGEGSTWHANQLVPILRHGALQDVYWTYSYGPIDDVEGPHGIGGVLVICNETTHQVMAERKLEHREEQLRLATQAAEVGTWDVDPVTDTLYWEERVKAMFGISADVAVSMQDFYDGLHPDDREHTSAAYAAAADPERRSFYDVEYRAVGKEDGVIRWVAAKGRGRFDDAGRCIRVIGTAMDITRRKATESSLSESEALLQEANRRKDVFLATLAHELRNPLAPLLNSLTLLRQGRTDRGTFDRITSVMERQLGELVRLTDDLMDSSRFSMGKLTLRKEFVSLNSILQQAVDSFRPSVEAAGQVLELVLPEQAMTIDGDVTRLAQVFGNLIGNAAKFTPTGGRIRVNARQSDTSVTVAVHDTGVGLAVDDLAVIFNVFSQLGSPLERPNNGLGIGLSLAKHLVEMHGGTLTAHSEGRGHGSEFLVELPLAAPDAAAVLPPVEPRLPIPLPEATRILVVDDNEDSAETLALLLQSLGHRIDIAHDGEHALALAETLRPKAVFLDLGMPGMNGYDVCRRIRAQPWASQVRIVALSGWGQEKDRRLSKLAGFDSHLIKPALLKDLQQELQQASGPASWNDVFVLR